MSDFDATERRINNTAKRLGHYPVQSAVLIQLIKHISDDVHDYGNVLLRQYNINNTDYHILLMLYGSESGVISPSQLSKATGEKGANITRICNELFDKQLIHRVQSERDRRKVDLSLTKQGLKLVESVLPESCRVLDAITEGFDSKELDSLEKMLKKMLVNTKQLGLSIDSDH